ncbi:hypothetical protein [Subtercola boreus]|uniref:Uncharacterized protein n=1 Tax=Subtercola boreus TaxID=120213 RepID=A0A3E0WAE9_9MICO|nr:hypothetical protein [Subtercola boreus]RFA20054.1 hypothetical protein B7R24_10795 [Subtercola boreus]RFA20184.1 hypothetical protein B7R23_10735 [Subtercola boreus]RFA26510.1 hypothetical protein B7R25_10860 [Subtercola boreus]
MDLETAAAELSVLPPAEFVGRRGDLSKEAKAAGDRQLAADIKRLTKPSVAAWAVNLLATRQSGALEKVVALGAVIRDAADGDEPGALAELATRRRAVLRETTDAALDLARQAQAAGGQLPAAVSADVEQTLQAVLADPGAQAAARTGRLVRALASNGMEAVDLDGAVAGPFEAPGLNEPDDTDVDGDVDGDVDDDDAVPPRPAKPRSGKASSERAPHDVGRRVDDGARRAARDARHALDLIETQLSRLTELRHLARDESESLADEIDDLEARLTELTTTLGDRRSKLTELEGRLDETDLEYGRLDRQREKAARLAETTARAASRAPARAPTQAPASAKGSAE